jgi:hypothetical protein
MIIFHVNVPNNLLDPAMNADSQLLGLSVSNNLSGSNFATVKDE